MRSASLIVVALLVSCAPAEKLVLDDGSCKDLSGTYALTGACSAGSAPLQACLSQDACSATVDIGVASGTATFAATQFTFSITTSLATLDCTGESIGAGKLRIHCQGKDKPVTCDLQGTRGTADGDAETCCDVGSATECGAGKTCRPASTKHDNGATTTACYPAKGTLAEGAACTRSEAGVDDCGPGLLCSRFGSAGDATTCKRLCNKTATCKADEMCLSLGIAPAAGVCVTRCDPFAPMCAADEGCQTLYTVESGGAQSRNGGCLKTAGTKAVGAACTNILDCVPGALCATPAGAFSCAKLCDDAHPCSDGKKCVALSGTSFSSTLGTCF